MAIDAAKIMKQDGCQFSGSSLVMVNCLIN